jgi:TP901 family phage tail tape measure protein
MAKRELLVTLGLDATSYSQDVKRANQVNKELDSSFKALSSTSDNFENTLQGLASKQEYLGNKMKVASELTEVYAKRLNESKQGLQETIEKSEQYKSTLDSLNKIKDEGGTLTKEQNQLLKESQQLYDKAQKSIVTYNTRISESKQGYDKTQTSLQELTKELTLTAEKEKLIGRNNHLDTFRNEISQTDEKFSTLRNSIKNFDNSLEGAVETQKHYTNQIQNTENLMTALNGEMKTTQSELNGYKDRLRDVSKELQTWEKHLSEIDESDETYTKTKKTVSELKEEYTALNTVVEFHEQRMKELSTEYKQADNSLGLFGRKIAETKDKIEKLSKGFEFELVDNSIKKLANGSIEKLQQELKNLENDFKDVTNEVKGYENTLSGLDYKQKYLNQSLTTAKEMLSKYEQEIKQQNQSTRTYIDTLSQLEQQLKENARIGKEMVANGDGKGADKQLQTVKEFKEKYEQVNKEFAEHNKKLKANEKSYREVKSQIASLKGELSETSNKAEKLERSLRADKIDRELSKVTRKLSELDSELRLATSKLEGLDAVFGSVAVESANMARKIELSEQALVQLSAKSNNVQNDLDKLKASYDTLNRELEEHKNKLKGLDYGDAGYNETVVKVTRLENAINELDNEINQHENNLSQLRSEHNNLQAEINETTRRQQQLEHSMSAQRFNQMGSTLQQLGGVFQSAGMALMPLTLAITGLGAGAVKTGSEFYQAMSQVQAISGATGSELSALTDKARELGQQTIWTAKDSADALSYMSLAGWDASQMLTGLPQVLALASAGGTDLAKTSDIVTDGLTAMRLSAEDAGMYVDVMASTMANSNTNVELMGETMKYAGAVAGTLGINMQDLSLAIGLMANSGIKGSMAGTSLRGGLTRLITPTDKAQAVMKKYGIEVQKTADGNVDLRATMEHLQDKIGGLDVSTQSMIAKTIFGQTAMNGWLSIINADAEAFDDLALAIDNSKGSAERMADTMTDNLWGDFQEMKSALQESLISIFDAIEPTLRKITQGITSAIVSITNWFNKLSPVMQTTVVALGAITASIAPLLLVVGMFVNTLGGVMTTIGLFRDALATFAPLFANLAGETTILGTTIAGLGTKLLLLTGIFGAVAVAGVAFWKHMQKDSIEGMDSITKGMSDKAKGLVEPFLEAKTNIDTVMLQMSNSNIAVTEDMVSRMEENLGSMVDTTENILKKSQKSAKKIISQNMKELAGASEQEVSTMTARIDEIYTKKLQTIQEKEKAVLDIQKKAQKEGRGLLVSEKAEIDQLLKDIQKMSIDAMSTVSTEISELEKTLNEKRATLNAESISDAVKSAQEKREKVVSESKKEYEQLLNTQKLLKNDMTAEERSKMEKLVELARVKKDNLIKVADEEYASLIQSARRLAKEQVDEIDWATGEVKSKWEVFTTGFAQGFEKIAGDWGSGLRKWTQNADSWGTSLEIMKLKWDRFWASDKDKKVIDDKIAKLEQQKEKMAKINDEVIKSYDRIKQMPDDISSVAYSLDQVLINNLGVTLAEYANDVDGHLTKTKEDFASLPPEVATKLKEYNDILIQAGVNGGTKDLVKYIRGDLKAIRAEFNDLPEDVRTKISAMEIYFEQSAEKINNISFGDYVRAVQSDTALAEEVFKKLPKSVQKALDDIPKDQWELILRHFEETAVTQLDSTAEKIEEGSKKVGNSIKEGLESKQEEIVGTVKETNDKIVEETKSSKEEQKKASEDNAKAQVEGFKGGLKDLPTTLKDELANAGVVVQEDGQIIVQNMEQSGRDSINAFLKELSNQLPELDSITKDISDRLGGIDSVRLGGVTKQLSEVNKWLGTVQKNAIVAYGSMQILTRLPFGNTTKALSQINQWLMRTTNRSKATATAMKNLTNLPFGNTTKGLSEVNQWLMRTTNRSKDTTTALKSITKVTFGVTTKGLSEVNKWLKNNVTVSANKTRDALRSITNVTYGSVTKGLSEVNRWLTTVKNTASSTRSALYAVASTQSSVRTVRYALEGDGVDLTQPAVVNSPLARDSWLDFADITKYKTSGGYYSPTSIKSKDSTDENNNKEVIQALVRQNELLVKLLTADNTINVGVQVDGRQIAKASARYMNDEIKAITRRSNRLGGIV